MSNKGKKTYQSPYSQEEWRTVKIMWESGQFASFYELRKHLVTVMPRVPALGYIKTRAGQELWSKGGPLGTFQDVVMASMEAQFVKVGLSREDVFRRIAEHIRDTNAYGSLRGIQLYMEICRLAKEAEESPMDAQDRANNEAYERRRKTMHLNG